MMGRHLVGYGYAVYRNGQEIANGSAALGGPCHVFDAETVGALRGLEAAAQDPGSKIWMCVDSTSVIWGLKGNAFLSSQWAYIRFHELVSELKSKNVEVRIRWCPGHQDIEGNERADRLADQGAKGPVDADPRAQGATVSGLRSLLRKASKQESTQWWHAQGKSPTYALWELEYAPTKEPEELKLPRRLLGHYLAMRTGHGDFQEYHARFNHQDAHTRCPWCNYHTSPEHLVHCPNSIKQWRDWPCRPAFRPDMHARRKYLFKTLAKPKCFEKFAAVTGHFTLSPRD